MVYLLLKSLLKSFAYISLEFSFPDWFVEILDINYLGYMSLIIFPHSFSHYLYGI